MPKIAIDRLIFGDLSTNPDINPEAVHQLFELINTSPVLSGHVSQAMNAGNVQFRLVTSQELGQYSTEAFFAYGSTGILDKYAMAIALDAAWLTATAPSSQPATSTTPMLPILSTANLITSIGINEPNQREATSIKG